MPIGSSLGITLPTVGVTAGPAWATAINTALTSIITAVETRVTPSGLNVNDDVEFNLNEALEVGALQLENKASTFTGASNIVKIYSYNGDLYFNDGSANAVRITANGNLNASAIAGIGGDYGGSNPAAVTFTDSTSTYTFFDNSSTAIRALLDCGQILLRRSLVVGAYAVKLTSPTLSADVTRTFLDVNPGSTSLLLISSTGTESTTRSPSIDALTIADDGVLHADLVKTLPMVGWETASGTAPSIATTGIVTAGAAASIIMPLPLEVGERLKSVSVRLKDDSATAIDVSVWKILSTGTTQLGSTASSSGGATSQTITVSGLTETGAAVTGYFVLIASLANTDKLYNINYTVDRVA